MSATKHLAKAFRGYFDAVMPTTVSAIQVQETQRAFYAGAWAFYSLVMNQFEPGSEETPADLQLMADLDAEMRTFRDQVKAGKA